MPIRYNNQDDLENFNIDLLGDYEQPAGKNKRYNVDLLNQPEEGSLEEAIQLLQNERQSSDATVMRDSETWNKLNKYKDKLGNIIPKGMPGWVGWTGPSKSAQVDSNGKIIQPASDFSGSSLDSLRTDLNGEYFMSKMPGLQTTTNNMVGKSKSDYIDLGDGITVNKYDFLDEGDPALKGYSKHDLLLAQSGGPKLGSNLQEAGGTTGFIDSAGVFQRGNANPAVSFQNLKALQQEQNFHNKNLAIGLNDYDSKVLIGMQKKGGQPTTYEEMKAMHKLALLQKKSQIQKMETSRDLKQLVSNNPFDSSGQGVIYDNQGQAHPYTSHEEYIQTVTTLSKNKPDQLNSNQGIGSSQGKPPISVIQIGSKKTYLVNGQKIPAESLNQTERDYLENELSNSGMGSGQSGIPEEGVNRFLNQNNQNVQDAFEASFNRLDRKEKIKFEAENYKIADELSKNKVIVPDEIMNLPPAQQRKELRRLMSSITPTTRRYGRDEEQWTEDQWQKFAKQVNPLNGPTRSALGQSGLANVRAARAMDLLENNDITQDQYVYDMVNTDIQGIMKGAAPTEEQLKEKYTNLQTKLSSLWQKITANPTDANTPNVKNQLINIINGLRKIDNGIIDKNLDLESVAFDKIIKNDPDRAERFFMKLEGAKDVFPQSQQSTQMSQEEPIKQQSSPAQIFSREERIAEARRRGLIK